MSGTVAVRPSDNEKRAHKRVADSFPLTFRVEKPTQAGLLGELDAVASDLGEGGLGAYSNHEIPAGAVVRLEFKLYNSYTSFHGAHYHAFEARGEVRHCSATDEGFRLGIHFLTIGNEERQFIAEYVKAQLFHSRLES